MLAGISTSTFYPELTENALRQLAVFGVQAAEVFFNSFSELEEGYVRELSRIAQDGDVKVLSIHPFMSGLEPLLFFSDYRRRFDDAVEFYKRFFHAANLLGAKILVFHGNRRESVRTWPEYFDLFGELMEAGQRMGVTVAQENVPRCQSYCPEFFKAMTDYLPEARFVLDTKQCIRAGYTALEMAQAMGDRVLHVHISDYDETHDCLPVGRGRLDLGALLQTLVGYGFDGGVLLELYRQNYGGYEELWESYDTILSAIRKAC
ncbi:sugar phosphate isomerase/epimerase family protein [Anaerotruncus rubiinfantis]|uniref:sugar phosphate isomerase/epimerase family protein n=1 Tax=Anaerotruncus rubiinfantis TaxID=1720200 RepID=UPI0011CBAF16|nr:sugar phosphate isomerase/epimerase [Anaerotruncus rubiinfantis]